MTKQSLPQGHHRVPLTDSLIVKTFKFLIWSTFNYLISILTMDMSSSQP